MFTTIWLETKDGAFVRKAEILKFLPGQEPEVILWGNRVFVQQETMEVYREVTFYPLIDRPQIDVESTRVMNSQGTLMPKDKLIHTVPLRIAEMESLKDLLAEISYISADDCLALPEDYYESRAKPFIERLSEAIEAANSNEARYEEALKLERGES